MKRIMRWFFLGVPIFALLVIGWITFYSFRSHHGSYHEVISEGGITHAMWFPTDFKPRQTAPSRPDDTIGRGRHAPQTQLPHFYKIDLPLLVLDRWLFHETVQTTSGQGDMDRIYEVSQDGRTLKPINSLK